MSKSLSGGGGDGGGGRLLGASPSSVLVLLTKRLCFSNFCGVLVLIVVLSFLGRCICEVICIKKCLNRLIGLGELGLEFHL